MANWIPKREQDIVDLVQKREAALPNSAKATAFGWNQTEVTEVLGNIKGLLAKHSAV
jgi:hypothetical protein